MRPALRAVLLVAVVGAMSVELEDFVAPMHPVELGSGGVDAAVVRKTVKEVEFKNSRVGKDSAGMDMNAALHEVERKVLAGGHPIQDSKAKPLKPKKKASKKAPKNSLGEGAEFHTLPDVKINMKTAAKHALQKLSAAAPAQAAPAKAKKAEKIVKPQPKAVEKAKGKEVPAKETDPNAATKAKKAPKMPAPSPPLAQPKKKGPVKAKTVPPPGPEAVKVVNEQLRLMDKEKAAAKAKKAAAAKANAVPVTNPKKEVETAKKKRKMAEAALAKKASDAAKAAKARAEQNKKEAKEVEAQRKRDDATDAEKAKAKKEKDEKAKAKESAAKAKAKAQKAKRAKELADEFKKGLKAGEKTLDMWKDKAGMSIETAIAHAHREAPHTAQNKADKAKEEEAAAKAKQAVDGAENIARRATETILTKKQKDAKIKAAQAVAAAKKAARDKAKAEGKPAKKAAKKAKKAKAAKKAAKKVAKKAKKVALARRPRRPRRLWLSKRKTGGRL